MRNVTMRLMVGLLVVGLLAVAGPATAQFADPLSLAASGVLLPFFGNGSNGDLSIIELAAPVGPNTNGHMIFYNAVCTRVISAPLPLSTNDVTLVPTFPIVPNTNGLVAYAQSTDGNNLIPLPGGVGPLAGPIHSRVYWINLVTGRARILEPITVDTYGLSGGVIWNPLRSGATFFAPQDVLPFKTIIYLICPKTTIQGAAGPPVAAFPATLFPLESPPFLSAYPSGSISGRVYDENEVLQVNIVTDCDCLQIKPLTDSGTGFGSAGPVYAAKNTFTELQASTATAPTSGFGFTGYKAVQVLGTPVDLFGRLSNASGQNLINGLGVGR